MGAWKRRKEGKGLEWEWERSRYLKMGCGPDKDKILILIVDDKNLSGRNLRKASQNSKANGNETLFSDEKVTVYQVPIVKFPVIVLQCVVTEKGSNMQCRLESGANTNFQFCGGEYRYLIGHVE